MPHVDIYLYLWLYPPTPPSPTLLPTYPPSYIFILLNLPPLCVTIATHTMCTILPPPPALNKAIPHTEQNPRQSVIVGID